MDSNNLVACGRGAEKEASSRVTRYFGVNQGSYFYTYANAVTSKSGGGSGGWQQFSGIYSFLFSFIGGDRPNGGFHGSFDKATKILIFKVIDRFGDRLRNSDLLAQII
ncbi:MAG: hypothetical protein HC799_02060 [Limnothrix sp. RL_2_0]|nr:hypothetical protein [Limnothrix sp. RL_2_0]